MAQKRATVTLYRYYYKSIEIEIDEEYLKGLTEEEMNDFRHVLPGVNYETDRYDIYDEEGDHIYGGHL